MPDWTPPPAPPPAPGGLRGVLGGTALYDQPRHAEVRARVEAFVGAGRAVSGGPHEAGGGVAGGPYGPRTPPAPRGFRPDADASSAPPPQEHPLAVEVGFDHGMRILDHARRFPDVRWLGLEIRKRRVWAAEPHAPDNCLLLRADARAVFAALLPPASVTWVYILFPTPTDNPRHLLLTPAFVASVERALAPGGAVYLATDVKGMYDLADTLTAGWAEAPLPPMGPVLSRRERVCARDALPVYRLCRTPPAAARE